MTGQAAGQQAVERSQAAAQLFEQARPRAALADRRVRHRRATGWHGFCARATATFGENAEPNGLDDRTTWAVRLGFGQERNRSDDSESKPERFHVFPLRTKCRPGRCQPPEAAHDRSAWQNCCDCYNRSSSHNPHGENFCVRRYSRGSSPASRQLPQPPGVTWFDKRASFCGQWQSIASDNSTAESGDPLPLVSMDP